MAYQVIARKFRPQSFNDFVGQKHITQTLINAMASERFPHAILFTGPRGTGKTTTARIVAKTLLCTQPKDHNPCNKCQACLDVTEGRHLDVIEIDGASNNGVDHIRELRDTIGYMPSSGKHKVYIIDEVHMLSTSAFNALLKTLEEPPEHVVFIFATTEVQKIPATILSRCQRFDFRNHTLSDIKDHLKSICDKESTEAEDSALWVIAKQAKGSIRDSLTLLDQIISFSHKKITLDSIMNILGLTDRNLLLSTLKAVASQSHDELFQAVSNFKSSGHDPQFFAEEFLELLRHALMIKMECHKSGTIDIPDNEIEEIEKIVEDFNQEDIHLLFDVSLSGLQRFSYSTDTVLCLEMLLFKLLAMPRLAQGLPVLQTTTPAHKKAQVVTATTSAQTQPPVQKQMPTPKKAEDSRNENTQIVAKDLTQEITAPRVQKKPSGAKTWSNFVIAVKQDNGFLGALLEHTFIHKHDDKLITLGISEKMKFLLDKLQETKNLDLTKKFLQDMWADKRDIEVLIISKDEKAEKMSPKAKAELNQKKQAEQEDQSIEEHPLVQAAEKAFKGQMTKIKVTNQNNMKRS